MSGSCLVQLGKFRLILHSARGELKFEHNLEPILCLGCHLVFNDNNLGNN